MGKAICFRNKILPIGVATLLLFSGCSTIIHASKGKGVEVKSEPPGAEIYVNNVLRGKTPATIDLPGDSGQYWIVARMNGETSETNVVKRIDPWVWGNVPLAVFPPVAAAGFIIDAYSGSWYRYEPALVTINLQSEEEPSSYVPSEDGASTSSGITPSNNIDNACHAGGGESIDSEDNGNIVFPDPADEYLEQGG